MTNVQHSGVDEGGIVKVSGDYLIVLRRGRLFSIKLGELAPTGVVDAFGPDIDPRHAWYDEMLVSGRTIVVVGYSYERGGTELGFFDLRPDGEIHHRATYHLRSNDYYSSRNYASRLIGDKLILYTPFELATGEQIERTLPALRRWQPGTQQHTFRPIYTPTRIYRPLFDTRMPTLHSVITCDLGRAELDCAASGVIGPPGREFYVSPKAVYVWVADFSWSERSENPPAVLYRLPLDEAEPSAHMVAGDPIDQFSFLESEGHLNVLVASEGRAPGMWASETTQGDLALLRLPLTAFSRDVDLAGSDRYRPLPRPDGGNIQNRFVGQYLLYGSGSRWSPKRDDRLFAYRYEEGTDPSVWNLGHAVDRIEALGTDGIVIGGQGGDLHFSTLSLGPELRLADHYTRPRAAQGELRSHGFFYRPEGHASGVIGLPLRASGRPGSARLFEDSASVLFLRNNELQLRDIGELASQARAAEANVRDDCRASCVDWYGNARPLFVGQRVFALLGYELVEGRLDGGLIREERRVSFAPQRQ